MAKRKLERQLRSVKAAVIGVTSMKVLPCRWFYLLRNNSTDCVLRARQGTAGKVAYAIKG